MPRAPRILALVPARAGSVGLPNKNLLPLGGRPLIARAVDAALAADCFADVVVSSDGAALIAAARAAGAWAPFRRPARLATSEARSIDVAIHALDELKKRHRKRYDAVCLVQPTAPLRTAADLRACVELWTQHRPCSVVSLVAHEEPHPYKLKLVLAGRVYPLLPGIDSSVPRQSLPPVYALNGAVYLTDVDTIRDTRSFFMPDRTMPYLMPPERSVNIDSARDLALAQSLLSAPPLGVD
jgi:CMP-N,N'-diacetyllegionaminic acid synthase